MPDLELPVKGITNSALMGHIGNVANVYSNSVSGKWKKISAPFAFLWVKTFKKKEHSTFLQSARGLEQSTSHL